MSGFDLFLWVGLGLEACDPLGASRPRRGESKSRSQLVADRRAPSEASLGPTRPCSSRIRGTALLSRGDPVDSELVSQRVHADP